MQDVNGDVNAPYPFHTCFGVLFPRATAILVHRFASTASWGYT